MFRSQQTNDLSTSICNDSQKGFGRLSLSNHGSKCSHPPIPRKFLQPTINGAQSLRYHQPISRSPYPSALNFQSHHFTSHNQSKNFPINASQQTQPTDHPITSCAYVHFKNSANV